MASRASDTGVMPYRESNYITDSTIDHHSVRFEQLHCGIIQLRWHEQVRGCKIERCIPISS